MFTFIRELLHGPLLVDHIDFQVQGHTPLDFDLAGNRLRVELPLPFSKGMPPTKLVPDFDLHDPQAFGGARKHALLKVMWDIPRPRFWQPDYGSVALTLWVHKNPDPVHFNLFERDSFILAIQEDLKAEYDEYNQRTWEEGLAAGRLSIDVGDDLISFGRNSDERFSDHQFNQRQWLKHRIVGVETHGIYCTPIDPNAYLSLDFEFMRNKRISDTRLADKMTPFTDSVVATAELVSASSESQRRIISGVTIDA
jgi:hypothetical protein